MNSYTDIFEEKIDRREKTIEPLPRMVNILDENDVDY